MESNQLRDTEFWNFGLDMDFCIDYCTSWTDIYDEIDEIIDNR